jgi:two-component system cell cycle response regulator CtrA
VRRHNEQYDDVVEIGNMKVDLANHATWIDDQIVRLSRKPQEILEILARRKGKLVSRETLFNLLYGTELHVPEPKILDVFMCKLRKSLQVAGAGGRYIRCEWTRGYVIDDPVVPMPSIKKISRKNGSSHAHRSC